MLELDGRQIFTTLEEKVDPAHTAVVVIDAQKEFVEQGGFGSKTGDIGGDKTKPMALMETLQQFLGEARRCGVKIVHVRAIYDAHYMTDSMYERLHRLGTGMYCQSDDPASGFYPGLEPHPGEPEVIKHRFDGFFDTDLDIILKAWGIKTIVTTGLATHGCVDSTARHGYFLGYYVVFPNDLTGGASPEIQDATLQIMRHGFAVTPSSEELIETWAKVPNSSRA